MTQSGVGLFVLSVSFWSAHCMELLGLLVSFFGYYSLSIYNVEPPPGDIVSCRWFFSFSFFSEQRMLSTVMFKCYLIKAAKWCHDMMCRAFIVVELTGEQCAGL